MQEFENVWKLKKFDRQVSAQLAEDLSIATPISNILAGRGLKDDAEGALKIVSPKIILNLKNTIIYTDTYIPELKLKSIHIHSKRIPKNYRLLVRMILNDSKSKKSKLWRLGAFDNLVFLERLISFIYRRFLMNKSQDLRFR